MRVTKQSTGKRLIYIEPEKIRVNPFASRCASPAEDYRELYESIRDNGIMQPIIVKKCSKYSAYEVISGQRRLEVCRKLKMAQVPCIEIEASDFESCLFSLLENLRRDDLTFFEEARAIDMMIKQWDLSQTEVSQYLSMPQSTLSNKLRLLRLTPTQQQSIENMSLSERHARSLIRISDDELRDKALNEVIVKGMNVEQTERYVDGLLKPQKKHAAANIRSGVVKDLKIFMNSINKAVKTMQLSGINAKAEKQETDDYISYTVIIPKVKS